MILKTFFDFCSGIGGGRLGLENAGLKCVGYSDTARISPITYRLLFDTSDEKNYGNLKKIDSKMLPTFDLLIAGFPCQSFSVIGRKNGFEDSRGQIIFHIARIISETQPKCFILENVKGLVTHDKGKTINIIMDRLKATGFDVIYKVLTSLDYGVPQMRQRVYFIGVRKDLSKDITSFVWPSKISPPPLTSYLVDNHIVSQERLKILDYYLKNPTNQSKYTIDDLKQMEGKILDTRMNDLRIYDGKCPTLRTQRDGILYVKDGEIHQLSGYEALLLQGFPKKYANKVKDIVSDRHLLMQAGNAMTVNVIELLAKSLQSYIKEDKNMIPGEAFEIECCNYLNKVYSSTSLYFDREGGMDSTKSDITVNKNDTLLFYMEAKEATAQSGQFVLIPDESSKSFIFSSKNHSEQNEMTDLIISYMNSDFDRFNNAGTAGEKLFINSTIFSNWIIKHYQDKNVKYVISKGKDYVIFPIEEFGSYFNIEANFRIKKSGSGEPAKCNHPDVKKIINQSYPSAQFTTKDKKIFAHIDTPINTTRFIMGKYTYYLSAKTSNLFEIRRLSNTYNMNVIFSIQLKQEQNINDLKKFETDIQYLIYPLSMNSIYFLRAYL